MKHLFSTILALAFSLHFNAAEKSYQIFSPSGKLRIDITIGNSIKYSLSSNGEILLHNNSIAIDIEGQNDVSKATPRKYKYVEETIESPFYKQTGFTVKYNTQSYKLSNGLSLEMRAYDTGMAYRFIIAKKKGETIIIDETAQFNFTADHKAYIPYSTNPQKQDAMAFQATYDVTPLSKAKDTLAFAPLTIDCGKTKVTIMESDLESYPGLFLKRNGNGFNAKFSRYPKTTDHYPWRMQEYVTSTENYIAKIKGAQNLPWRIIAVANNDTEMPTNNLVYALASPNRIGATDWIKPGKVAWDWWNDWGLSGVDFKAGINMPTYKHYIDFAAKYGLEYIILDEGWYNPKSGNMLNTISEINLPELVEYGKRKNVGIVLWTVFNVLDKDLKAACKKYSEMGIKGFKVDFLDRNDQAAVEMVYRICEECSKHKLILDLHGIYAPTGINRTYPNVLNFEGVFGMEEAKWSYADKTDMPLYDVTFPFIRMQAGYVDFTPGGFRNASKKDFQPIYYNPLTMGTRCHQLAMYIIHDSPFTMLADNPIIYEQESECTQFIASLPTVYDEMKIVDGKIGEYIIVARRLGDDWYIAGQTNWNQRKADFTLDFIENPNEYEVEYIIDGLNADKDARDYVIKREGQIKTNWSIHMASGGGFAMKIIKKH